VRAAQGLPPDFVALWIFDILMFGFRLAVCGFRGAEKYDKEL
jgi:hypothetical protein